MISTSVSLHFYVCTLCGEEERDNEYESDISDVNAKKKMKKKKDDFEEQKQERYS